MDQRKINLGRGKVVSPKEGILDSLLRDYVSLVSILEIRLLGCKDH